ncbi:MAG: VIT family protein [Bifidobacterium aquikefiri]|uniref:VIT family n=1 Tax=Bifidobacterium aquikefiri TaxID=1653207 RepID=A0A261G8X1_9BIFI|nr:VIT family protein [Bifidobacterium aquikefiri]OZG67868.1 VIT family [Bifidobacterium aquikefiri]
MENNADAQPHINPVTDHDSHRTQVNVPYDPATKHSHNDRYVDESRTRIPSIAQGGWLGIEQTPASRDEITPHAGEIHNKANESSKALNSLRAAVLGANDGIVSVAGTILGVAGADNNPHVLLIAGVAAISAGAFSMAGGEYVSVSAQRDTEKSILDKERWELINLPVEELDELTQIYETKGMTRPTAYKAAYEAMHHDALRAHALEELNIDPDELTNPWQAAISSFFAFVSGGLLPLLISQIPASFLARVSFIVLAVAFALLLTGFISAQIVGTRKHKAIIRNVVMGLSTMLFAWVIGKIFGVTV